MPSRSLALAGAQRPHAFALHVPPPTDPPGGWNDAVRSAFVRRRREAIFTLARRGDLQAVKRALELDADPNIPDTLGRWAHPFLFSGGGDAKMVWGELDVHLKATLGG